MANSSDARWNELTKPLVGLSCLELGGPTELFYNPIMLPLYPIFSSIDNVNNPAYSYFPNVSDSAHTSQYQTTYALDCTSDELLSIPKRYDVVLSSHVIEHIANPIRALKRVMRLLNPGGYILSILPNPAHCWDRSRPTTTIEHLLKDFNDSVGEDDLTHLDECLRTDHPWKHQWGETLFRQRCEQNVKSRILHHHCFSPALVQAMHEAAGFQTGACEILAQNPLQIVYRGQKPLDEAIIE